MDKKVHIEGEGVAAACCAQLFSESGQPFSCSPVVRPRLGAVLLSKQTMALLAGIFPSSDLISVCHPIHKRIVAWGPAAAPITVAHSAFVIAEDDLLTRLWGQVSRPAQTEGDTVGWRFLSSGAQQRSFGTRTATVVCAVLKQHTDEAACWIESLDSGWLFLLPRGDRAATVICVGATPVVLLDQSRVIADVVDTWAGPAAEFPGYPRIAIPLCGDGWLTCGSGALAFDPLCGEGTGNAARQAYLATALVGAAGAGEPVEDLLAHYISRQMQALLRHLQICLSFYESGGSTAFWQSEAAMLEQGMEWAWRVLREQARPPTHRLVGRKLEPISTSIRAGHRESQG